MALSPMYPPRDESREQPQARSLAPSTLFRIYIALGLAWLGLAGLYLLKHVVSRAVVHAELSVYAFLVAWTTTAELKERTRKLIVLGTVAVFVIADCFAGFLPF